MARLIATRDVQTVQITRNTFVQSKSQGVHVTVDPEDSPSEMDGVELGRTLGLNYQATIAAPLTLSYWAIAGSEGSQIWLEPV